MQENGSDFTLSKPTEGVKLSGAAAGGAPSAPAKRNCKWIDSLETPAWRGPKVQRTNRKQWECSDYEYIMAQAASRTNLSGNRTEKILDRYS